MAWEALGGLLGGLGVPLGGPKGVSGRHFGSCWGTLGWLLGVLGGSLGVPRGLWTSFQVPWGCLRVTLGMGKWAPEGTGSDFGLILCVFSMEAFFGKNSVGFLVILLSKKRGANRNLKLKKTNGNRNKSME